jgi:hypothetical protein
MGRQVIYPCYSVDASGMIALNLHYPYDMFTPVWSFLGELADAGRILVCEQVKDECHDDLLQEFLHAHRSAVVEYHEFEDYILAFQREAVLYHIELTRPNATSPQADPFVVALALMLEGRALEDLRAGAERGRVCTVVSYEKPRAAPPLKKIPDVCTHYMLHHEQWPSLLRSCAFRL